MTKNKQKDNSNKDITANSPSRIIENSEKITSGWISAGFKPQKDQDHKKDSDKKNNSDLFM